MCVPRAKSYRVEGNEVAKRSRRLSVQPPQFPTDHWDICFHGEKVQFPHKTWARMLTPQHSHTGIHAISWRPLKWDPYKWVRWLSGWWNHPVLHHSLLFGRSWCHGSVADCASHSTTRQWRAPLHSVSSWIYPVHGRAHGGPTETQSAGGKQWH